MTKPIPDAFAQTATEGAGQPVTDQRPQLVQQVLGKYEIRAEIGRGAMGVVYQAFDQDLERIVAIKVLHDESDRVARARLLREARAMAKISHPNVVQVHEVGTHQARDFIVMDFIEGETLAQWQKSEQRSQRELLEAWTAAGHGLHAAHRKGLVHRDFKPHNVLRSKEGQVMVSDFGLASAAIEGNEGDLAGNVANFEGDQASSLRTASGSLLGTPAYMAPEQWQQHNVGPAADQFALAIAVWESLTKQRPFYGDDLATLRASIAKGSQGLDASALPRRLRAVLLRALSAAPSDRYSSVPEFLSALHRAARPRSAAVIAILAVAAAVAAALWLLLRPTSTSCIAPALDPALVWSDSLKAELVASGKGQAAAYLSKKFALWTATRDSICREKSPAHVEQLRCLDGVLSRFVAGRAAIVKITAEQANLQPLATLADPALCTMAEPPRLTSVWNSDDAELFAHATRLGVGDVKKEEVERGIAAAKEPCRKAFASLNFAQWQREPVSARETLQAAAAALEECNDDLLRARFAARNVTTLLATPFTDAQHSNALRQLDAASARLNDPLTRAYMLHARALTLALQNKFAPSVELHLEASALFAGEEMIIEQLRATSLAVELLLDDPHKHSRRAHDLLVKALPLAKERLGAGDETTINLTRELALVEWFSGNFAKTAELISSVPAKDVTGDALPLRGVVVDQAGKPLKGATVVAARTIVADQQSLVWLAERGDYTTAITDESGKFSIAAAPATGAVGGELQTLRSAPATLTRDARDIRLVLGPTNTITGSVQASSNRRPILMAASPISGEGVVHYLAPVQPDGSFVFRNLPQTKFRIHVRNAGEEVTLSGKVVELGAEPLRDVAIAIEESLRHVAVTLKGTTLVDPIGGQLIALNGHQNYNNAKELRQAIFVHDYFAVVMAKPAVGENIPQALVGKVASGQLLGEFTHVPNQPITICGIALPGDITKPEFREILEDHLAKIPVGCVKLSAAETVATIAVPPLPRFD